LNSSRVNPDANHSESTTAAAQTSTAMTRTSAEKNRRLAYDMPLI
jgi:hypothetical protein